MVDIAAKRAEGKGKGYEKWATLHNLKQMAATVSIYEESGFSSPEELEAALLHRAELKRCTECGGQFLPKSNRGKYCPDSNTI